MLKTLSNKRKEYFKKNKRKIPLVLKIAPDLIDSDLKSIIKLIKRYKIEGIIATNTSINKKIIQNKKYTKLQGGISGNALYKNSNNILKKLQKISKGKITLIGVGGIDSGEKVFKKIKLGANAVQVLSLIHISEPTRPY